MSRRGVATVALLSCLIVGCGQVARAPSTATKAPTVTQARTLTQGPTVSLHAHPQAIEPVAGAAPPIGQPAASAGVVSVGPPGVGNPLAQPVSETQIRHELAQSGMSASTNQATLTPDGLAVAPVGAPAAVQAVIAAGNTIARLPYRYGGGHLTYEDTAYDCSGSISYVFAAAHLLDHVVVSGQLENWGDAGPGKWITVFSNAGHTFMYVAGLRFDTVALAETGSRWSNRAADEPDIRTFVVRHPAGL